MNKTASVLKRNYIVKQGRLLSDIDVTVKGENLHFDNLVIGKFGVLNVVCLNKIGELYGNENDEFFALVTKKLDRELVLSPILAADKNERALREIFAKEKVYNIKIESIIVIENKACKPLFTSQRVPLVTLSALKKHLNQEKFDYDNKVNADEVLKAIERYKN